MIEPNHSQLSVERQCTLIDLPRSTFYHRAKPTSEYNALLMALIDEE